MRIFAAFILACFALALTACHGEKSLTSPSMQTEKLKQIESGTGLVLPPLSRVIEFSEPPVVFDPVWIAKIVIPESSYAQFKVAVLREPILNATVGSGLEGSTSWWKPVNADFTKQYLASSHTFVKIVSSREATGWAIYVSYAYF
jgi:hypothetical protein